MKTFSFKLNKDGVAETNVPEEYFLEKSNICAFIYYTKDVIFFCAWIYKDS